MVGAIGPAGQTTDGTLVQIGVCYHCLFLWSCASFKCINVMSSTHYDIGLTNEFQPKDSKIVPSSQPSVFLGNFIIFVPYSACTFSRKENLNDVLKMVSH